jgi:NAD(P)-dependent dehydrogenase (short-subunit alcohol dehydrogenase family)
MHANDAEGGDSMVADAFAIAEQLRAQNPAAFHLLATWPVAFRTTTWCWVGFANLPTSSSAEWNMAIDPLFDFSGKIIVVTGGSRGLGYQMVKAFAERGAEAIVIASRKLANCEAVADEVRALGCKALAVAVHAAKWDELDGLIERVYAEYGRIDILINNAGMSPALPSHEVTEQLFDSVIGLNFKGPFRLATQVAKRMADGDGGVIINVSSSGALMPLPYVIPYGSSKAALNAMTRSLAREYGPKVRVNTLSPGPFLTDIAKAWTDEAREQSPGALGRPGNPEEIVTAALFLASPASSFVTSGLVRVDGGLDASV